MTHVFHNALPGYDDRQILHDGCPECEDRGQNIEVALAHMDKQTFARAWKRAYDWRSSTGDRNAVGVISQAEVPLLRALFAVQVHLQYAGAELNGEVPA